MFVVKGEVNSVHRINHSFSLNFFLSSSYQIVLKEKEFWELSDKILYKWDIFPLTKAENIRNNKINKLSLFM